VRLTKGRRLAMQNTAIHKKVIHPENARKWWLHREKPTGWTLFSIGILLIIIYLSNPQAISDFTIVLAWLFNFVGLGLLALPDDSLVHNNN